MFSLLNSPRIPDPDIKKQSIYSKHATPSPWLNPDNEGETPPLSQSELFRIHPEISQALLNSIRELVSLSFFFPNKENCNHWLIAMDVCWEHWAPGVNLAAKAALNWVGLQLDQLKFIIKD
ncbi:hypothetical protein DSO57_1003386 [Entomophthora muscae]|uniref:Uncharacterized protein n=1 Tax=Entomophthora muscae TaxID=34485 RepID=A0ACC2TKE8_9FUNG|nr:hypothetical protein DSO57_1003386 [Entomophthora muscae]